jgi:hypothetical protein
MSNDLEIIRNKSSYPGHFPGLKILAHKVTSSGGGAITVETGCAHIIFAIAYSGTTLIAVSEGSSTTYPGTKTVTFTAPAAATEYLIIGSVDTAQESTPSSTETIVGFDTP